MRIPNANEVFGWRIPRGIPTIAPNEPDNFVQQGLASVQGAVQDIAGRERDKEFMEQRKLERAMEIEQNKRDREREIEQHKIERAIEQEQEKAQRKLEQAERDKEHSRLQTDIINMRSAYDTTAREIYANPDIPDDKKREALEAKTQEIKAAVAERFPEDKKHMLEPIHAEAMYHATGKLAEFREKDAVDTARANVLASINSLELQAAKSPQDRTKAIAMFNQMSMYGYGEQEKVKLKEAFLQATAQNEVIERINKGDYTGVLKDLNDRAKYLPDMDPRTRDALIAKVQTDIEQENRRKKAEAKAYEAERRQFARETLADLQDAVQAGMPVSAQEWITASKLVKGNPGLEKRFEKLKQTGTSDIYQQSLIQKDPLKYGAASLGIKIEDLNLTDPNNLAAQITQRKALAVKIRDMYGLKYAPLLQASEAKMLQEVMKTNAASGTGMLNNLSKIIGSEGMNGIAAQMAAGEKPDIQSAMMVGYVGRGKAELARSIGEGQKFIEGKVLKMPKEEELRTVFDDRMGKAMDGLPQIRHAHYQSFAAVYAQLAAQRGVTSGERVDKKIAQEAFDTVVGTVSRYRGKEVVLPEGYDESRFMNFMRTGLTEEYIKEAGGVQGFTAKEALKLIKDDAKLYITSVPNTYRVSYLHDGVEYDLATTEGKPFEIVFPDPKTVKPSPWLRFYRE